MRRTILLVWLLLSAGLAHGGKRRAVDEARQHYLQGEADQRAAAYPQAIAEYQAAYQLAPLAELRFDIAQCYRLAGDDRHALAEYQAYLAAEPSGRGAADARGFVATLTQRIADQTAADQRALLDSVAKPTPDARPAPPLPPRRVRPIAAMPTIPPAITPRPGGRGLRLAGLLAAGAGALLLTGGIVYGLEARADSRKLAALPDGAAWDPALVRGGQAAEQHMIWCVGAGSVAVVGGGVLYWLGWRRGREPAVSAAPGPRGASLVVTGRF